MGNTVGVTCCCLDNVAASWSVAWTALVLWHLIGRKVLFPKVDMIVSHRFLGFLNTSKFWHYIPFVFCGLFSRMQEWGASLVVSHYISWPLQIQIRFVRGGSSLCKITVSVLIQFDMVLCWWWLWAKECHVIEIPTPTLLCLHLSGMPSLTFIRQQMRSYCRINRAL